MSQDRYIPPKIAVFVFGFLGVCVLGVLAVHRYYFRDYLSFASAIRGEGFEIKQRWLYDEDLTLEDFGILVAKGDLEFWIDVRFLSSVRKADTPIDGIILQSLHEGWEENERLFPIDSAFWRQSALPEVYTARDFLREAHVIFPKLIASKSEIPLSGRIYFSRKYPNCLIVRDDPRGTAPINDWWIEDVN